MTVHSAMSVNNQINKLDVYRNGATTTFVGEVHVTEEIRLEPELMNSLYRRGRRRLRDIQTNCGVNLWLDKLRGVLHLSGSKASVAAAKTSIAGLGGPRKRVSTAMWAELLRTRKLQAGDEAAVARIQLHSGCRIHVERSSQEVHLFGEPESVAIAEKLLKELDQRCVEEILALDTEYMNPTALQAVANSCGVTLQTENAYVCILGLRDSVKKAIHALKERGEDLVAPIVKNDAEAKDTSKVTTPPRQITQITKDLPQIEKNMGKAVCPTCHACPFCAACGHPTAFVDSNGFPATGNPNLIYIIADPNVQAASETWSQIPYMPFDYCTNAGGAVENTTPMAFMMQMSQQAQPILVPHQAQQMPLCFVPAPMVPPQSPL
jgi:hypothetical protein